MRTLSSFRGKRFRHFHADCQHDGGNYGLREATIRRDSVRDVASSGRTGPVWSRLDVAQEKVLVLPVRLLDVLRLDLPVGLRRLVFEWRRRSSRNACRNVHRHDHRHSTGIAAAYRYRSGHSSLTRPRSSTGADTLLESSSDKTVLATYYYVVIVVDSNELESARSEPDQCGHSVKPILRKNVAGT